MFINFYLLSIKVIISSYATRVFGHFLHSLKFISTTWNVLIAVYVRVPFQNRIIIGQTDFYLYYKYLLNATMATKVSQCVYQLT